MTDEIVEIWQSLVADINTKNILCSSEKSLCFNFAWKLKEKYKDAIIIDFENTPFGKDFSDGTFLDLIFELKTDATLKAEVVGVEFKFMKSGVKHRTNQTHTRAKIINDIKRLCWLKSNKKIDKGYFLCATNEMPYINESNKKKLIQFKTYQNIKYQKGSLFPKDDKHSKENIVALADVEFYWNGVSAKNKSENLTLDKNISYAWLSPIII